MTSPKASVQTKAEARREVVLDVLRERGPCLASYLLHQVISRTKQFLLVQQLHQDIKRLAELGLVTHGTVTGLGPAMGHSRPRGQKMMVVKLVPASASAKR